MDPLNKYNADNFNIKPHERVDEVAIEHNFIHQRLMALINYIKNALRSIAYVISPKSNPAYIRHMHGEDIITVEPTDCGNEVVNQEMLRFSDHVNKFWGNNTPEEIVDFFVQSAAKNAYDIRCAASYMYLMTEGTIPGITQEEFDVFSKIHNMVTDIGMVDKIKRYGNSEFKVTLRDIKTFYNVFVKYMNYAIENEPRNAARVADLEKLFFGDFHAATGFKSRHKHSVDEIKVLDSDRDVLKSNDGLVVLLQNLKEHVLEHDELPSGDDGHTFYNLTGNILGDNKNWPMHYSDLTSLKRLADTVRNILSKRNNGELTESEYHLDMLREARKVGIAPLRLVHDLLRTAVEKDEIPEDDFKAIISKHKFYEKTSSLMDVMESLPDIVDEALAPIDLDTQLKHVIEINILDY